MLTLTTGSQDARIARITELLIEAIAERYGAIAARYPIAHQLIRATIDNAVKAARKSAKAETGK